MRGRAGAWLPEQTNPQDSAPQKPGLYTADLVIGMFVETLDSLREELAGNQCDQAIDKLGASQERGSSPREVVVLLDTSGSMDGPGISQLRVFAGHVLDSLNPQDTFRLVAFSDRPRAFHHQPLPATPENLARAEQFIRGLHAGGGTEMLPALLAGVMRAVKGTRYGMRASSLIQTGGDPVCDRLYACNFGLHAGNDHTNLVIPGIAHG